MDLIGPRANGIDRIQSRWDRYEQKQVKSIGRREMETIGFRPNGIVMIQSVLNPQGSERMEWIGVEANRTISMSSRWNL